MRVEAPLQTSFANAMVDAGIRIYTEEDFEQFSAQTAVENLSILTAALLAGKAFKKVASFKYVGYSICC